MSGDWPQFDLGEWLALRSRRADRGTGGQRLMDWLGPVDVHLDRATVFGFEFRDVIAKLRSEGELWRIARDGTAGGRVRSPCPTICTRGRPIVLDMKRLYLASEESNPAAAARAAPERRSIHARCPR